MREARWCHVLFWLGRRNDIRKYSCHCPQQPAFGVDLKAEDWQLWYRALSDLADPELPGVHARKLAARGFRAQHIQVMQDYVQQNQPQRAVLDSERLTIRSVKAHRSQAPRFERIAAADAASYAYQFERAREEAKQRSAAGLLERLDKQRQERDPEHELSRELCVANPSYRRMRTACGDIIV
jgi:hypothetical protein